MTLELFLFFFSLRKLFLLAYLLTVLCDALLLLFVLLSDRFYWHDGFTPTLDIPRRFQIYLLGLVIEELLSAQDQDQDRLSPKSRLEETCNCLLLRSVHLVLLIRHSRLSRETN